MTTLEAIPREHREVYQQALAAAHQTATARGWPIQDDMALADMHRVIYHGSIKPLMGEVARLTGLCAELDAANADLAGRLQTAEEQLAAATLEGQP